MSLSDAATRAIERTRIARAELDAMLEAMPSLPDLPTLAELTFAYAERVLGLVDGNKSEAARAMGLHRSRLRRILDRGGLGARSGGARPGSGRPRSTS